MDRGEGILGGWILGEWGEGLKKYKLVADGWSQGWGAWQRECG